MAISAFEHNAGGGAHPHIGSPTWPVRLARHVVPLTLAVLMAAAAGDVLANHFGPAPRAAVGPTVPVVPAGPPTAALPRAGASVPAVPRGRQITVTTASFAALARHVPPGTLTLTASGWQLNRAIEIGRGGRLRIEHRRLALRPSAFIEVAAGGALYLGDTKLVGTTAAGRPDPRPTPRRAFLLDVGGRMQLARDQIADLGHVADGAAGVTFRAAAPGSSVADSLITGGFAGVVASDSADVRIVRNRIESTTSDAIDVGSSSRDVTVAGNTIDRVGDHGVLVSGTSRGVVVARNQIRNSRRYAIELFNHVSANRVSDNAITRCFDGIVVTAASRNLLTGNVVTRVRRYGFRVSTGAQANLLRGNVVTSSPVGIYVYGHAYGEQLLANRFRFDQLDIRVKEHAGHNIIRPLPAAVLVGR